MVRIAIVSLEQGINNCNDYNCILMFPNIVVKYSGMFSGFHLATKIWGGSALNEWAYLAHQVPWDVFLGEFL